MIELSHEYRMAFKRLSAVEVDPLRSHQHEMNGVAALRAVLGPTPFRRRTIPWIYLEDSGEHRNDTQLVSWYDSREGNLNRSAEWRLYFDGVIEAREGDLLLIIRAEDLDVTLCAVVAQESSWERQLTSAFGAPTPGSSGQVAALQVGAVPDEFAVVLEDLFLALGLSESIAPAPPVSLIEEALAQFTSGLPAPPTLSSFIRERVQADFGDPDATLVAWWQAEAGVFLALEGRELELKLAAGFDSVDEFLSYSLSVHNRRKARAGRAFERHLAALFEQLGLRFDNQALTEGNRRPDFLFPGRDQYLNAGYPADRLTMLGAKTTCKDRWRQVLTEAARIPAKHLCTLEPAISAAQLREMREEQLTLVVPRSLLSTYSARPGDAPISLADFVRFVRERQ